ncbi:MAG: hypothetical protein U0893_26605 [Chloroflexota bacterium]
MNADGLGGDARPADGRSSAASEAPAPALPPLTVSALLVTKADLISALRVYLPQLTDLEAIDGERFLLSVVEPPAASGGA